MKTFFDDRFSIDFMQQPVMAARFEWRDLFRVDAAEGIRAVLARQDPKVVGRTHIISAGNDPDHWDGHPGRRLRALICKATKAGVKQWFNPIEQEPELFLEFANLTAAPRTRTIVEGRIQAFANTYGPLRMWDRFTTSTVSAKPRRFAGHSCASWEMESRRMRHAIQLWDWTGRSRPDGKADTDALRKAVVWVKEESLNAGKMEVCVEYRPPAEDCMYRMGSSLDRNADWIFPTWEFGDRLRPAGFWIAKTINQALSRDVTLSFVFLQNPNRPTPAVVCNNLRGCLWYQFYRAYIGEFRIARCLAPDCGGWMRYDRRTKQMHRRCANRIRQRRSRAKK